MAGAMSPVDAAERPPRLIGVFDYCSGRMEWIRSA